MGADLLLPCTPLPAECEAGYGYRQSDGKKCAPCGDGKYAPGTAPEGRKCTDCPYGFTTSTSTAGSAAMCDSVWPGQQRSAAGLPLPLGCQPALP
jgi:hypothetical protein